MDCVYSQGVRSLNNLDSRARAMCPIACACVWNRRNDSERATCVLSTYLLAACLLTCLLVSPIRRTAFGICVRIFYLLENCGFITVSGLYSFEYGMEDNWRNMLSMSLQLDAWHLLADSHWLTAVTTLSRHSFRSFNSRLKDMCEFVDFLRRLSIDEYCYYQEMLDEIHS